MTTPLRAPAHIVWSEVTTAAGVNRELMPLLRMTVPRGRADLSIADVTDGERVGRSWLLLFGLVPFDYDDLVIERVEPGRAFHERSTMLSQRRWEHDRTVEPAGTGCIVTDSIRFEPKLGFPAPLLRPLFLAVFRHRHRRLRARYGPG